ncbi:flagellar hook protein FliD [Malaciobacter molluscorum]|uniref:flagellar filament capping protein FliD n=1 Tax=Malaciobacter molluscorum TaxID=1032072 RepID=UPI00100BA755|nr:flagellar filament capping protein FliD [Malaciobacter molluscorum]RXJ95053.1 flagellar hook protein FliD [Malaciobacter molluscorum]
MADGILGLGTGKSNTLNQELIDKLKAAERKGQVEPLETDLENLKKENEKKDEIMEKYNALLEAIKDFDLFTTSGVNAFQQKSASSSGSSVIFDAPDPAKLDTGTTNVIVTALAQRDVFQSNTFDETARKEGKVDLGTLSIAVGSGDAVNIDTNGKTYDEVLTEIDKIKGVSASIEEVGSGTYRIVIKSTDTGTDNALTISGDAGASLGYNDSANHTVVAKDMKAVVDGVEYVSSSNTINVSGGLKITAVAEGPSSLSITDDVNTMISGIQNFLDKYNELVKMVQEELTNPDTPISDKSSIRNLINGIKEKIMGGFGEEGKHTIFEFGFEMDTNTYELKFDSEKLQKAFDENFDELYDVFIGRPESKGLGTQLVEYMNDQTRTDGIYYTYDKRLTERKKDLTEEKDAAIEKLDSKYNTMALQFAEYTAIITRMENSFSGLQLMIAQSKAGN